jgi:hypothetical protein
MNYKMVGELVNRSIGELISNQSIIQFADSTNILFQLRTYNLKLKKLKTQQ